MTRLPRLLLVAVLAALALSVSASPAAAKGRPCWAAVINDWYDNGRMDRDYSIACYQQALQHLPPDVREYADAQDVIGRALTAAIARQGKNAQSGSPTDTTNQNVTPVVSNNGGGGPSDPNNPGEVGPTGDNGSGGKSLAELVACPGCGAGGPRQVRAVHSELISVATSAAAPAMATMQPQSALDKAACGCRGRTGESSH